MRIRQAIPEDSAALIRLTSLTPMKGKISLRIDRKPDFFALLKQRGKYIVLVAENEKGKLIGSFSAARQSFVSNNSILPVYYLGDLKVHPDHNRQPVAYRLIKTMQKQICFGDVDLFICTAADGNEAVSPFFSGRAGFPPFQKTGVFNVYQLLPRRFSHAENVQTSNCQKDLSSFYNTYYKRYSLYPEISHLENCINLTGTEDGKVVAALSLFDPAILKQNVVIDIPLRLSLVLHLLKGLKPFLPLPSLPSKGAVLKLLYIKYFGFKDGNEKTLLKLIRAARDYAFRNNYHFLTIAVDEKDETINRMIRPMSRFNFRSTQLVTSLANNKKLIDTICKNICYEDYSLI